MIKKRKTFAPAAIGRVLTTELGGKGTEDMPQQAKDDGDSDANFHRQYDRQIRLWGLDAQKRMTGNASAVARRVRVARSRCTDGICACT